MSDPLVSICMPVYNKAGHVGGVLEQILSQPYGNIEVVVSDNGSDDGSSEILRDFARRDRRVKLHRLERTISLNENWRLVMALAGGDFVKVQSADDPLHPEFIPAMLEAMLRDPAIEFTVCREQAKLVNVGHLVDEAHWKNLFEEVAAHSKELTETSDQIKRAALLLKHDAFANTLGNIFKVLVRRSCLPLERWRQISGSYPMPQAFADWDFLLRLFLNHRGCFIDRVLSEFMLDPQSPAVKVRDDPRMLLAAHLQEFFMPLTMLTDPTLRALRERMTAHEKEKHFAQMGRELRRLMIEASEVDTRSKVAEGGGDGIR